MTWEATDRCKRLLSLWLWVGLWVVMFLTTHVPVASAGALPFRHGDKILHFGLYFLLTYLGGRYLRATGRRLSVPLLLVWAVVYCTYAAFDEWLQQFVGRSMSPSDWVWDVVGILAATATLAAMQSRRALSERRSTG